MTLEQFKEAAKNTGYHFNRFFSTSFVRCTPLGIATDCPVFVAEITSKARHVGLYYPNAQGGATLVKGFGKERMIEFYDSIENISANNR